MWFVLLLNSSNSLLSLKCGQNHLKDTFNTSILQILHLKNFKRCPFTSFLRRIIISKCNGFIMTKNKKFYEVLTNATVVINNLGICCIDAMRRWRQGMSCGNRRNVFFLAGKLHRKTVETKSFWCWAKAAADHCWIRSRNSVFHIFCHHGCV